MTVRVLVPPHRSFAQADIPRGLEVSLSNGQKSSSVVHERASRTQCARSFPSQIAGKRASALKVSLER
jgi:hypothetical protein